LIYSVLNLKQRVSKLVVSKEQYRIIFSRTKN